VRLSSCFRQEKVAVQEKARTATAGRAKGLSWAGMAGFPRLEHIVCNHRRKPEVSVNERRRFNTHNRGEAEKMRGVGLHSIMGRSTWRMLRLALAQTPGSSNNNSKTCLGRRGIRICRMRPQSWRPQADGLASAFQQLWVCWGHGERGPGLMILILYMLVLS